MARMIVRAGPSLPSASAFAPWPGFIVKQPSAAGNPIPAPAHPEHFQVGQNVRHAQMWVGGYQQQRKSGASLKVPNVECLIDDAGFALPAPFWIDHLPRWLPLAHSHPRLAGIRSSGNQTRYGSGPLSSAGGVRRAPQRPGAMRGKRLDAKTLSTASCANSAGEILSSPSAQAAAAAFSSRPNSLGNVIVICMSPLSNGRPRAANIETSSAGLAPQRGTAPQRVRHQIQFPLGHLEGRLPCGDPSGTLIRVYETPQC